MATLPIHNKEGKQIDTLEVSDDIFGRAVNQDVIHQAVVMYQASLRQGNASTKDRGEVSGGGRKPWRQKGTGRARQSSIRSPLWRGGGVTFGPKPRDFGFTLPKKIKIAALRESLNVKYQSKDLFLVVELKDKFSKTKEFAKILQNLKLTEGRILALLDGCDDSAMLVSRNLPRFDIMRAQDVNAYDVMKNKTILATKSAFNKLIDRIKN